MKDALGKDSLYMLGAEDGSVELKCSIHSSMIPIAYYTRPGDPTYSNYPEVCITTSYREFVKAGKNHLQERHAE